MQRNAAAVGPAIIRDLRIQDPQGGLRRAFLALCTCALLAACSGGSAARSGDVQVSDAWINTRAENEITPMLSREELVKVETRNGVVFLGGNVRSAKQAEQIERSVSGIRGVREVKNELKVR